MRIFERPAFAPFIVLLVFSFALAQNTSGKDRDTFTAVGQAAPAFALKTLDGASFSIPQSKGAVTLINFFATWCGPCLAEMPRLEKDVWQRFRGKNFAMIAIAREQSSSDLVPFVKQRGFSFPVAPDPKREVYSLFARQYIPRTYVLDSAGKIVFQSQGYNQAEFDRMIDLITRQLAR
ncbi:MAG: TlpA family protein disulfide reductase [Acidobacteria bacterium]|nr:MAG: TlpA family protein disulfide reductase [Acidobacteriota bacterium]